MPHLRSKKKLLQRRRRQAFFQTVQENSFYEPLKRELISVADYFCRLPSGATANIVEGEILLSQQYEGSLQGVLEPQIYLPIGGE